MRDCLGCKDNSGIEQPYHAPYPMFLLFVTVVHQAFVVLAVFPPGLAANDAGFRTVDL
jgi:hypothetical protein